MLAPCRPRRAGLLVIDSFAVVFQTDGTCVFSGAGCPVPLFVVEAPAHIVILADLHAILLGVRPVFFNMRPDSLGFLFCLGLLLLFFVFGF